MTQFSEQELLHFNQQGLIPGPNESVEEFTTRANYCLTLKEHLSEEFKAHLGSVTDNPLDMLSNGFNVAASAYNISPTWIPIFFSNYKLPPWHGGCAWIFQMTESSPTAALLQLRQSLHRSNKYMGIYHRDELVAHELAHVGRMKFEEPQFEEIIAYRTSFSTFRRWLGPIVQSSFESMLFVLTLALIIFVDIFLLTFYNYEAYLSAVWLKIIPVSMICIALIRLWSRQRIFDKCLTNLDLCLKSSSKALNVVYRLTDREIIDFSRLDASKIEAYATENSESSLRWQVIKQAYFDNKV